MIIKEAPSIKSSSRASTASLFYRDERSGERGTMNNIRHRVQTKNEKHLLHKTPLSRPSTASTVRSYSSSRVSARGERTILYSRPSSGSTVRSSSSPRVVTTREISVTPHCKEAYRQSRPTSRCTYHVTSRSRTTQRPESACTETSPMVKIRRRPTEDASTPKLDNTDKRTWTSKDILMHLLDAWQPQLSSSYRETVEYVPTNQYQMRAYINAMLLEKPCSPYLDKFRAAGRLVETINHLNPHHRHSDSPDVANNNLPDNSQSSTQTHINQFSPDIGSKSFQHHLATFGHLPALNHTHRLQSSLPNTHRPQSGRPHSHSGSINRPQMDSNFDRRLPFPLEKSQSHGHFRL